MDFISLPRTRQTKIADGRLKKMDFISLPRTQQTKIRLLTGETTKYS
jgi:hypothetical protein